jgi:hypothetical protein
MTGGRAQSTWSGYSARGLGVRAPRRRRGDGWLATGAVGAIALGGEMAAHGGADLRDVCDFVRLDVDAQRLQVAVPVLRAQRGSAGMLRLPRRFNLRAHAIVDGLHEVIHSRKEGHVDRLGPRVPYRLGRDLVPVEFLLLEGDGERVRVRL